MFNDAPLRAIRRVALGTSLADVSTSLVQLVRLASRVLPDDIGLVVVRLG